MKKEPIIAIVFGILLGVGVGVVILNKTTAATNKNKPITEANNNLQQVAKRNEQNIVFEIASPTEGDTVKEKSITIKGKATKESLLVVQSPVSNKIVKNDKEDFSIDFPLALGENVINVTFYPNGSANDYQERIIRVYYLPE